MKEERGKGRLLIELLLGAFCQIYRILNRKKIEWIEDLRSILEGI